MAAGAGRAAAGGARRFAKALAMEGLQQNLEPRRPAAQRPGAAVNSDLLCRGQASPTEGWGCGSVFWAGCERRSPSASPDHGGASPERGLGAAPPAPGAAGVQSPVSAAGAAAPRGTSDRARAVRAEPVSRPGRCLGSPGPARPTAPHGKGDPGAGSSARAGTASAPASVC